MFAGRRELLDEPCVALDVTRPDRTDQYMPVILQLFEPSLLPLFIGRRCDDVGGKAVAAEDVDQLLAGERVGVVLDSQRMITGAIEDSADAPFRKQPAPYETSVDGAEVFEQLCFVRFHRTAPLRALEGTLESPSKARSP